MTTLNCLTSLTDEKSLEMLNKSLNEAAKEGNLSRVKDAINNGADIECQDEKNKTPLENASENGHLKIVKYLVDNNANVDAGGSYPSLSPLGAAASMNHLDIVKCLIKKKANIEAIIGCRILRPLHIAAERGHLEVVQCLVQNGACVNARVSLENSPLHCVADPYDATKSNVFFNCKVEIRFTIKICAL